MTPRSLIISALLLFSLLPLRAQDQKQLKREVTLYNPYKPSLSEVRKKSYLPEINDTARFRPEFKYDVTASPFVPQYTISPIKPATLVPEPLSELYRSFVNIGFGSYTSPFAEVSITNERSKNGALGFYGRHFSNNGWLKLDNDQKVDAHFMDNDLSLFGKRFFSGNVIGGSVDYTQRTRFAYGKDVTYIDFNPKPKDVKLNYGNIGGKAYLSSINPDSTEFAYDFGLHLNYFYTGMDYSQNNFGLNGKMSKMYKGFYTGGIFNLDIYNQSATVLSHSQYVAELSPFVTKSNEQWNFRLGLKAVIERSANPSASLHVYPDLEFGFAIVPNFINFFSELSGKLERNDPLTIIGENPFIVPDNSLLRLPNTDHQLIFKGGLKGNSGIEGNYELSASYSLINDMLFYSNLNTPISRGNYFIPVTDDVDLLNIHGALTGNISDKLSFSAAANYYEYTLSEFRYPWNKPEWDASAGLKYNLRDKIIAGMELTAIGERKELVTPEDIANSTIIGLPYHVNLNLNAEYRYSKILSFWAKLNNISWDKHYEWAYYPTYRFLFMLGFTYSL
jgi:hypothetical protein